MFHKSTSPFEEVRAWNWILLGLCSTLLLESDNEQKRCRSHFGQSNARASLGVFHLLTPPRSHRRCRVFLHSSLSGIHEVESVQQKK